MVHLKFHFLSQAWWYNPVITKLLSLRQECDHEVQVKTFLMRPQLTKTKQNRARDVAQLVECLYNIPKALVGSASSSGYTMIDGTSLSPGDTETGWSEIQGQPLLHFEFKANLGYMRPCPPNKNKRSFLL